MSSWSFSRRIAFRYLWTKRSEAFISIISVISIVGVAIGVMVLNIVMAVMTGFEHELKEKIVGADSHIVLHKLGGRMGNWEGISESIGKFPEIASVSPFTYHQVLVRSDTRAAGVLIRGILPNTASAEQVEKTSRRGTENVKALFNPPVLQSAEEDPDSGIVLPGILLGAELARTIDIHAGLPISVLSPQVTSSPFGLVPKYRRFMVAGIYSSGLVEYESAIAYVDLKVAQRFFGMGDNVSGLEVRLKDINVAPAVRERIVASLGGIAEGYTATDWTITNKPLWDALRLEKKVYFIVLLLIVVMASFSIITTLIMVVLEKRKDIAILKTMGASKKSIGRIFRIQGATIGALGTVLGLTLGWLGCLALKEYGFPLDQRIFQMSSLPVQIDGINFLVIGVAAFLICLVATIYPARRAASLEPVDALRHE